MDSERERLIAEFMEIIGDSVDKARQFLQATNWHLEEAIQLYYAGNDNGNTGATVASWEEPMASSFSSQVPEQAPQAISQNCVGDDYVRPPLPVKREALYEDIFQYRAHHMSQTSNQPSSVDAFRNFEDEAKFRAGSETNGVADIGGKKDSLAALYRPPFALMYHGSFEQAKMEAAKQGKWLLVNLQSTKEFSSYTLNRDTWAHDAVKDTIRTTFVFWQVYDDTEEGRKVCTYYKLTNMPAIMILDPLTGQKMRAWDGMVGAERLLEDLVLFMDKSPLEQKPLNFPPQKRPRESTYVPTDVPQERSEWDEDEDLRQALAASLEDTREPTIDNAAAQCSVQKREVNEQDVKTSAAKASAQGTVHRDYPSLPEEPALGTAMVCRVAVRFPDGRRGQRRFLLSDPIQCLWSFCYSMVKEAEQGRSFHLTHTIPGMVGGVLAYDMQASIEGAGVANSMLAMAWD